MHIACCRTTSRSPYHPKFFFFMQMASKTALASRASKQIEAIQRVTKDERLNALLANLAGGAPQHSQLTQPASQPASHGVVWFGVKGR